MEHCTKCGGYGELSNYSHIRAGVCFQCKGKNTRGITLDEATKAEIAAKAKKRKEKQRINKEINLLELKLKGSKNTLSLFDKVPPENELEKDLHQRYKERVKGFKEELERLKEDLSKIS